MNTITPDIVNISPTTGPMTGRTLTTLYGNNFTGDMKVLFGKREARPPIVTDHGHKATCYTPRQVAGLVDVKVIDKENKYDILPDSFLFTSSGTGVTNIQCNPYDLDDNVVYAVQVKALNLDKNLQSDYNGTMTLDMRFFGSMPVDTVNVVTTTPSLGSNIVFVNGITSFSIQAHITSPAGPVLGQFSMKFTDISTSQVYYTRFILFKGA